MYFVTFGQMTRYGIGKLDVGTKDYFPISLSMLFVHYLTFKGPWWS